MARRVVKRLDYLMVVALATTSIVSIPMSSVAVAQTSQDQISQAVATLLASNVNGGDQLASAIKDLVLANPAALAVIIAAVKANGNDAQQAAAGQGLGLAAQAAVNAGNQQLAVSIQAAVAGSGMPNVVASFTTAAGDATIAAISNAGGGQQANGGGGGGVGGPTGGGAPSGGGGGGSGPNGTNGGTGTQQAGLTGSGGSVGTSGSTGSVSPR